MARRGISGEYCRACCANVMSVGASMQIDLTAEDVVEQSGMPLEVVLPWKGGW